MNPPKLEIVDPRIRYFVLINTGYEEDFPYRLGEDYVNFVERCKNNPNLIKAEKYIRSGYENIMTRILNFSKQKNLYGYSDKYRKSSRFIAQEFSHPIFLTYSDTTDSIDDVIKQARDLNYCHIWGDDPTEKLNGYMIDNKTWLIYLKLEAESG